MSAEIITEPPPIAEDSKMETPSLKKLTVLPKTRHANSDGEHGHCLHGGQYRGLGTSEEGLRPRRRDCH